MEINVLNVVAKIHRTLIALKNGTVDVVAMNGIK